MKISTWKYIGYVTCPKQYDWKFEQPKGWTFPIDKQRDFAYGKVIHSVIQEGIIQESSYDDMCKSLWAKLLIEIHFESSLEGENNKKLLYFQGCHWLKKLQSHLPKKEYIIGFEQYFNANVGVIRGTQYYITGRYDLLLQSNDKVLIGDIKTRSTLYDPNSIIWDSQLGIYSWSYWKEHGIIPHVRFYELSKVNPEEVEYTESYFHSMNPVIRIVNTRHTEESILEIDKTLKIYLNNLNNRNFEKRPGFHCNWCEFNYKCWNLHSVKIDVREE